jgi:hypothetical protein
MLQLIDREILEALASEGLEMNLRKRNICPDSGMSNNAALHYLHLHYTALLALALLCTAHIDWHF